VSEISIRKATTEDIELLQDISIKTFTQAFSADNSEENMRMYLEEAFNKETLTQELGNANSAFYFAKDGDRIIGYMKVNFGQAQTELKDEGSVELERIYALEEYYGKGVGPMLYNNALQIAIQAKADYLWLGVWEFNHRAIRFYTKNGFTQFDKHIFRVGNDNQTDIMMKRVLG